MTPKTSLNKSAFNMFSFTLKKNLGFTLIASILALVLSPVYLYNTIKEYIESYDKLIYNFSELFFIFSIVMAVAATAFLMVLLYINFSYLYKKSASDFFHALPMKRSTLLCVRFLGSFVAAIIPLTLSYIGAFSLTFLDYVSADRGIIIQIYLFTVAMMFMLGLFTLLFIVTAGGVFDSIIALLAVNVGIPIIALFISGLCRSHLYGFDYSGDLEPAILSYTTPFGYAIVRLIYILAQDKTAPFFIWYKVLGTVAVTIALAAVVLLCYNRRKSEKVGGAYAFKIIPEIIGAIVSALGLFVMAYIFSSEPDEISFWIAGAVGAGVACVVYFLIINRGFKKVKNSLIVAAVALIALLITNLGIRFDIFGWEYKLPKTDEIASVTVRLHGEDIKVKNIPLAVELNREIIKGHNDKSYRDNYIHDNFYFEYTLKNGETVTRRYDVERPVAEAQKLSLINQELSRQLLEDYNEFKKLNCQDWNIDGYFYDADANYIGDFSTQISEENTEKLILAYIEDLKTIDLNYFDAWSKGGDNTVYISGRVVINERTEELEDGTSRVYSDYKEYSICVNRLENYPKFKEIFDSLDIKINYVDEEKPLYD